MWNESIVKPQASWRRTFSEPYIIYHKLRLQIMIRVGECCISLFGIVTVKFTRRVFLATDIIPSMNMGLSLLDEHDERLVASNCHFLDLLYFFPRPNVATCTVLY